MWFWVILIALVFLFIINGLVLILKKSNKPKTVGFIGALLAFLIIAAVFLHGFSAAL